MGCTGAGLVSIIILFIATVLNIISFSLPLWSTSDIVNPSLTGQIVKANFAAGLWGYCTDVQFGEVKSKDKSSVTVDKCYMFHTSNDYDIQNVDEGVAKNFSSVSICDGYSTAKGLGSVPLKVYTSALAMNAGMDSEQFGKFLDKSCGATGWAALFFGICAMDMGVFAFIGVVLSVTCCKTRSCFNSLFKVFISLAFVCNFFTFILWVIQSKPLGKADDVSLSGSFVLNILSAVLFLIAGGLLGRHSAMKADP
jgi:hypothetical protein